MQKTLRILRSTLGLTRQQLAHGLKVSADTIRSIEDGSLLPDIPLLIRIATYFSVSTDYLLSYRPKYRSDQLELLEAYNSLNEISKGMLLERALILAEESTIKKRAGLLGWRAM